MNEATPSDGHSLSLAGGKLLANVEGLIGWLIFNNPARRNAVSVAVWDALPAALDFLEGHPDVKVLALRGAGDQAFISGLDISEFDRALSTDPAEMAKFDAVVTRASTRLRQSPKPTIAMVHGYCIGAGIQMMGDCDLCIAADNARFAVAIARMGLGYPAESLRHLCDLIGVRQAKNMLFTGRTFTAGEALTMGLINAVETTADLEAKVRDYCNLIGANAPLTIRGIKAGLATMTRQSPEQFREQIARLNAECIASEDFAEGQKAFREKRKPQFKGR